MPTKNPRVNIAMEKPLYVTIQGISKRDGVSMSMVVRDLIKESLELREDVSLAGFAEEREKTFTRSKALSHKELWG
ncbi:MAG: antitoxin, RHH family protein [Nitrospirae bacterium]|nr:MAG: antitoxin, RHH family protein [Nitrospirota bacterium]